MQFFLLYNIGCCILIPKKPTRPTQVDDGRESKPNLDNFVLDHLRRALIHSVRHTQISFR